MIMQRIIFLVFLLRWKALGQLVEVDDFLDIPGTSLVSDSDDGSGTSHGVGTGRTFEYAIADPTLFEEIKFKILNASLAFDGSYDDGVPENHSESIFSDGEYDDDCTWTATETSCNGETRIYNAQISSWAPAYTRLNVSVNDAVFVAPMVIDLYDVSLFNFTILFEASIGDANNWGPAYEKYNLYQTTPGANDSVTDAYFGGEYDEVDPTPTPEPETPEPVEPEECPCDQRIFLIRWLCILLHFRKCLFN